MNRLYALDGLRGLAATTVVLVHYTGADGGYLFPFLHNISAANIAVVFFFGLSAFVIAMGAERSFSAPAFLMRRIARIVPLYVVAFVASIMLISLLEHDDRAMQKTLHQSWVFFFFVLNWFSATGNGSGFVNELGHLWSLCVEMQFYFAFAFFFPIFRKASAVQLIVFATAIGLSARAMFEGMLYFNTLSYTEVILFCGAAGVIHARGKTLYTPSWPILLMALAVTGLSWSAVTFEKTAAGVVVYLLLALLICAVIVKATESNGSRILGKLRWLGTISYGMYLWHLPLKFATNSILAHFGATSSASMLVFSIYLFGLMVLSWATYKLVEEPCIHIGHRYLSSH